MNKFFDKLLTRVDEVSVARLDMGKDPERVESEGARIKAAIQTVRNFAMNYADDLVAPDDAEIDATIERLRTELAIDREWRELWIAERDTARQSRARLVKAYRILRPCLKEQARYDFEWENLKAERDLWEKRANALLEIAKAATAIVEAPYLIRDRGNYLITQTEFEALKRAVEECKSLSEAEVQK